MSGKLGLLLGKAFLELRLSCTGGLTRPQAGNEVAAAELQYLGRHSRVATGHRQTGWNLDNAKAWIKLHPMPVSGGKLDTWARIDNRGPGPGGGNLRKDEPGLHGQRGGECAALRAKPRDGHAPLRLLGELAGQTDPDIPLFRLLATVVGDGNWI